MNVDVIIPAHNAEKTIESAVRSVLRQIGRRLRIRIVVVDDGSTDGTLAAARRIQRRDKRVRVVSQPHAGAGAARNAGLEMLDSDWVLFLDADDFLDPGFLAEVARFLRSVQGPQPDLIVSNIVRIVDGRVTRDHPLRWRFARGARVVALDDNPEFLVPNVASVLFRRSALGAIRFSTVRWSEDFEFVGRFLLSSDVPRIGVVPRARYYYRIQGDSQTGSAWGMHAKYVEPFTEIYLPLARARQAVPAWLQHALLYEICWYLEVDRRVIRPSIEIPPDVRRRCALLIARLLRESISATVVRTFAALPVSLERRSVLLALTAEGLFPREITRYQPRSMHALRKYTYFVDLVHEVEEVVFVDGRIAPARYARTAVLEIYGVPVARERILWFPRDDEPTFVLSDVAIEPSAYSGARPVEPGGDAVHLKQSPFVERVAAWMARRISRRALGVRRDAGLDTSSESTLPVPEMVDSGAWVFLDRSESADDNAEHLYRFVREHRAQQVSVFVLSRRSPDWSRLESEGFILVDAECEAALDAIRSAEVVFCSDLSDRLYQRAVVSGAITARQGIVYLQHGITTQEQSRLLNAKRIDLMVTSTIAEQELFTGDGRTGNLTPYEVRLLGMPRLQTLARRAQPWVTRHVIVIAPTWSPETRGIGFDRLREHVSTRDWFVLVASDAITDLRAAGARVFFYVHPNDAGTDPRLWYLDGADNWVAMAESVQSVLAQARVLVTDRSSTAFDAVVVGARAVRLTTGPDLERPIVVPERWTTVRTVPLAVDAVVAAYEAGEPTDMAELPALERACVRIIETVESDEFLGSRSRRRETGKVGSF